MILCGHLLWTAPNTYLTDSAPGQFVFVEIAFDCYILFWIAILHLSFSVAEVTIRSG